MKHVPSVQEELLKILTERLIPWIQQGTQAIALGRIPLSVAEPIRVTPVETPVLEGKRQRHSSNILARWPDQALASARIPYFICVLDGEADFRLGITDAMAQENKGVNRRYGQMIVTLPTRSWLLIPPGVPQPDGTRGHREPQRPPLKAIKLFWMNVLPEGLILHTCETINDEHNAAPGLFINGTHFTRLVELIGEELQSSTPRSREIVRTLQLALLLGIEKVLVENPSLTVANTEYLITTNNTGLQGQGTPSDQTIERALRYINTHLHCALTVRRVAAQAYVSAPQLNRLFRARLNSSVMAYVTRLRVESASSLLRGTDLSINEVSDQLGYRNRTYFSRVFLKETGLSPTSYRRKHRYHQDSNSGEQS